MLGPSVAQPQANKFYHHLHEIEIKYFPSWSYRLKYIPTDILDDNLASLQMKKPVSYDQLPTL